MIRSFASTALTLFLAAVLVLVGARFLALLVHANRDSDIVQRTYRHSDFWVKPFFGIAGLHNHAVAGGGAFEPASLLAFAVYLLGGMLVLSLIGGARGHRFLHLFHA